MVSLKILFFWRFRIEFKGFKIFYGCCSSDKFNSCDGRKKAVEHEGEVEPVDFKHC